RPESEVEPDYEDITGQVVDAWEEPETAGAVPDSQIEDLPQDMQEELAGITGAQYPEELAEMAEEGNWEEDLGNDQPESPLPDLEETEDTRLGRRGGTAMPPGMEDAADAGPGGDTGDEIMDMTGYWSEEEFSDTAPASDQPAVEIVEQSVPDR